MSQVLIITGAVALAGYILNSYRKASQKKKQERERLALEKEQRRIAMVSLFREKMGQIITANQSFAKLQDYASGYFSSYQLSGWKQSCTSLHTAIKEKEFTNIGLEDGQVEAVKKFLDSFCNCEQLRSQYNARFVTQELTRYNAFFSNIEGRNLDNQQRSSIVTDEDNNIVIAGAGSGKTTTIVGKVNYILDRYKVAPEEILLISFTNKSATTLAERINIPGVEAKTFHKFGKDIITAVEKAKPSVFEEVQYRPLLQRFFYEELKQDAYLEKVTAYFTNLLKPYRSMFEFDNQGDYIQCLKDQNHRPYKPVEMNVKGKMTPRMEIVKSIEECRIANFLYFNNVAYEYEFPYEHRTATEEYRQYKPDFKILQGDKVVYLEHFGIDRLGNVPKWFSDSPGVTAKEAYHQGMNWKRELHKEHGTTLIESYSYEMMEDILFDNLAKNLAKHGITLKPKTPQEIWQLISTGAQDEVKSLISLFGTFITLLKSNNYSMQQVADKNRLAGTPAERRRNATLLEIIAPLFRKYEHHLQSRGEIDFSDMINRASSYIAQGKLLQSYRYIIIDEFQDISIGRYGMLKALRAKNPSCRLFCVGDDWQSIYRFTGSDLTLFRDFEQHFGKSESSKIETTYRYNSPLIELSGNFIEKNPNQAKKKLKGMGTKKTEYAIRYSEGDSTDDTQALLHIFTELSAQGGIEDKEILILGRYSFDYGRIKNLDNSFLLNEAEGTITYFYRTAEGSRAALKATFMTVHKAKGLEADIVIVLNCNAGRHGFPAQLSDDPVLNLLLSEADHFENGEERRLFYVAMTRAKEQLYLVADAITKSKFILELETSRERVAVKKCRRCQTTDMLLKKEGTAKNGNRYKFYGCANFIYGCEHTEWDWENRNGPAANNKSVFL